MKHYPIMITDADLKNYGIGGSDNAVKNELFLKITHQTFYEFIVYTTQKNRRKKLIEKHREDLEEDIKDILLNIAFAIDKSGDFDILWDGSQRTNGDQTEIKSLQERIISVIPTMVWNQIAGLQPNITFAGGEI